ncbi:MAG TPA: hypothetical protein VI997_11110 [Candidatus Thermoplasmatota archaeon]|nr:hypothetical protein [Candidatus Thermoplasmatota archaeon]
MTAWHRTAPEIVRSMIALAVVLGGLSMIGLSWWTRGTDDAQRLVGMLGGVIGVVTGYYFGRQGVESAQAESSRSATVAAGGVFTLEEAQAEADRLKRVSRENALVLRRLREDRELLAALPDLGRKIDALTDEVRRQVP